MAVPPVSAPSAVRPIRRGRALVVRPEATGEEAEQAASEPRAPSAAPHGPAAPVGAQLLGERQRRGLRAGPGILEQARSTYLQTEYAGSNDRRPRKGQIARTEI